MRILVNATTCVVGGGIQVAVGFISQAIKKPEDHQFLFAVSLPVRKNLGEIADEIDNLYVITTSPAWILSGKRSRLCLLELEKRFQPDVVFTIFGPAYIRFKSVHLCGFADGWVTHRTRIATRSLPVVKRLRTLALCQYKRFRLSSKDYYWVESEIARQGLIRLLHLDLSRIRVISNTYAEPFAEAKKKKISSNQDNIIRIFCLAAPYPHKNLIIIPDVAHELRKADSNKRFLFIVTLPDTGEEVRRFWEKARAKQVTDMIENIGTTKLTECPAWYALSDMVFLPTLLETFSVTYLEAMVMERPIVTTDLDFAHDICGDAAVYYAPLSPKAAADAIMTVAKDERYRESLIESGRKRLARFPSPAKKYRLMLNWISEAANRKGL